jgi:hypothetical protein
VRPSPDDSPNPISNHGSYHQLNRSLPLVKPSHQGRAPVLEKQGCLPLSRALDSQKGKGKGEGEPAPLPPATTRVVFVALLSGSADQGLSTKFYFDSEIARQSSHEDFVKEVRSGGWGKGTEGLGSFGRVHSVEGVRLKKKPADVTGNGP